MSTPHGHDHDIDHAPDEDQEHHHGHDHNLRAAYMHVLADALTSVLAIVALLAGKFLGLRWLDPAMGIVGAILVARWSWGLIRDTAQVLLDHQAEDDHLGVLREAIEGKSTDRITDLHLWSIGHGIFAAEIAIISDEPKSPDYYKSLIPAQLDIVHATVEIQHCADH